MGRTSQTDYCPVRLSRYTPLSRSAGQKRSGEWRKGVVRTLFGGWALSRAFSAETRACSHCGSTALYPHFSLFGELGGVLGRMRYACHNCRRHTWLRPGAKRPPAPPDEPELEVPGPPNVPAFLDTLDALDIDATPLPPAPTDLRALDEDLACARQQRKKVDRLRSLSSRGTSTGSRPRHPEGLQ